MKLGHISIKRMHIGEMPDDCLLRVAVNQDDV